MCFVSLLEVLMAQCEGNAVNAILGLLKHVIFVLTALSHLLKAVIRTEIRFSLAEMNLFPDSHVFQSEVLNGFVLLSGIEPTGNRVMRPAVFTVDTFSAGQGQVTVYVEDPEGRREEVKPVLNEGKKTYSVTYIPQVMGPHKVCSSASQPV